MARARPLRRFVLPIFVCAGVLAAAPAAAQQPDEVRSTDAAVGAPPAVQEGRPLPIADYGRWRTIAQQSISSDGRWVGWVYRQLRTDDVLHLLELDGGREVEVSRADGARFSPDARWVAYFVQPPRAEVDGLERDGRRVPRKAELRSLETGETHEWSDVAAFEFSPASGHFLVRKARGEGHPRGRGDDLILRDLARGTDELVSAAAEYSFSPEGNLLAHVVGTGDREANALHLTDLETGRRRTIDSRPHPYNRLTWSDDGSALAVLRGETPEGLLERENALVVVLNPGADRPRVLELGPSRDRGMPVDAGGESHPRAALARVPEGLVLSEFGPLSFDADARRLFLGVRPQETEPEGPPEGVRLPDVHVFHWNDDRLQTVQQVQANADRRRTWRAVVHLPSLRLVQLADEEMPTVSVSADGRWGVGADGRAYVSDWEEPKADYYRVETETGERTLLVEAQGRTLGFSPHSTHFLYWRDGHVWAFELEGGAHTNLTASAPVGFVDEGFDRVGTPPPYGIAGWTEDGEGVILEHRYDLWLQPLDGSPATELTGGFGEENEIRLRLVRLEGDAEAIDPSGPLLLHGFGRWTKRAGYFLLEGGEPRELVYEDRWFGSLAKAAEAGRLLFTQETFREFPDLHVSGLRFDERRRLTDANPHQDEYRWGERILFDFEGPDGIRLQGTLIVPDGRAPGERLPMLVNFYEQSSQNLHRYQTPQHVHRPSFSGYASDGYLVMQPDIHFRTRTTHTDMLESVEGAVRRVIEMGYADPDRVGLNGHSFSGGGSAYIAGRSNMFAAVVAGAAPINLRSEFNVLFRGSGQNNHRYDIHGQGRYGTDPFSDLELYLDQSPITHVPTLDTPMIYLHGENDQVVEYLQGMELYNAARFLGKPIIFLSYPGEGHGLSRLENRLDFQIRIRQFYDHYLKGEPAPGWMTEGVPYLERDRRRVVPDSLLVGPGRR
jgi:dipeptidyl aminopeptidase/acylaminoacyl peptidase